MHAETPRLPDKTIVFSEHEVFNIMNLSLYTCYKLITDR